MSSLKFLFSIDLEDIRHRSPNGERYQERVPQMTERYLQFLLDNNSRCTFFVVGQVVRAYPDLIRKIVDAGHEIALHTDSHITLDCMTPEQLREDTIQLLDSLRSIGITDILGFRAPCFSLLPSTTWAYSVLHKLGLRYSSSVLPSSNPRFGWSGHSEEPSLNDGVIELPMTVWSLGRFGIPLGGGVYFRALPRPLIWLAFRWQLLQQKDVLGYFHPYDIDYNQERYPHPDVIGNWFYDFLLFFNRQSVFSRLKMIIEMGFEIVPYRQYLFQKLDQQHVGT